MDPRPTLQDDVASAFAECNRLRARLALADQLAKAAQGVKDAPFSLHQHEDLQAYNRAWFNLEQALTAYRASAGGAS